jgi:hypothetical protein
VLLPVQHDGMWGGDEFTPWYPQTVLYRESRLEGWKNAATALHDQLYKATQRRPA